MACRIKILTVLLILISISLNSLGYSAQEFAKIEDELLYLYQITKYSELIAKCDSILNSSLNDYQKTSIYFYRAQGYLKSGDISKALDDYEIVIELNQINNYHFHSAVNFYLELLYSTGEEKRLRSALDKLKKIKISDDRFRKKIADYYLLIGDPVNAYDIYEELLKNKRIDTNSFLKDLVQSSIKGKVEDKLEKKLIEESKKSNEDKLILAKFYYWSNQYSKALKIVNELKQISPGNVEYVIFLGEIYWANGDKKKSFAEWENLHLRNPDDLGIIVKLGDLYEKYNLLEEAYEKYRLYSDKIPSNLHYLMKAASILHLQGEYEKEIDLFFTRFEKGHLTDVNSCTQIEYKLKELAENKAYADLMIKRFEKIEKSSKNFNVNVTELSILVLTDNYVKANTLALKLVEENKNDFNKINNYILNKLRNQKGYVILKNVLSTIIEKKYFPYKEKDFQLELANTYYRLKEYKNAIKMYESIPGYSKNCNNRVKIAEIYMNDLGDFNSALELLESCPASPGKNYILGIQKLIMDKPDEAIEYLASGTGPEKHLWLAFAYILKNNREDAIQNFDQYILYKPESEIAGDVLSISRQVELSMFEDKKSEDLFISLFINNYFKQYSEVDALLSEFEKYGSSSYYSEAQIIKARRYREQGKFREAINILAKIPDIYYRKDYTIFLIGEIYRLDLNNKIMSHEN